MCVRDRCTSSDIQRRLSCRYFFFQADDGIRFLVRSRGLGDVYKRQVLANTLYPLKLPGLPREACLARAEEALALVGLADRVQDPARRLSVGQQQRLALARAAALQPELLFLDEPSASLDPAATRAVEEIVLTLARRGTKIVMTTHDLAQARRLAGDVVFLHRGRVLEQAPAEAFFREPATEIARAFLRGGLVW